MKWYFGIHCQAILQNVFVNSAESGFYFFGFIWKPKIKKKNPENPANPVQKYELK
jgi:hypothetical protein